jgi:N-acetylmuramic acid 6-phosphate etherase
MTTETIETSYADFDRWPLDKRLQALIESNQRALKAVAAALPALTEAAQGIRARLMAGGRLIYIGAGTSGRLALQDAAELPPTFGFDRTVVLLAGGAAAGQQAQEGAEDDEDAARREVAALKVTPNDAAIGLAASGKTPYTVTGLAALRAAGAFTVGIANNPDTPLVTAADVGVVLESGPEVIAGSTRLAAGTAQKVALNMLSSAVMPELGGVYKNLMVGMRPVNAKLHRRAEQIVMQATGEDSAAAHAALEATNWQIREAILVLKAELTPEAAREHLRAYPALREALRVLQEP